MEPHLLEGISAAGSFKMGQAYIHGLEHKTLGSSFPKERAVPMTKRGTPALFEVVIPFGLYFLRAEGVLRISSTEGSQIQQHPVNELNSFEADQNGLCSLLALECYF